MELRMIGDGSGEVIGAVGVSFVFVNLKLFGSGKRSRNLFFFFLEEINLY